MKNGMLFPGYGSQFVGMGKELYDDIRLVQEFYEQASHCLDKNFVKLCFASSDADIKKVENAYPSLFLTSVSTAHCIKEQGITCDIIAGHGIGEYSAIASHGGLSFADGLYLLNKLSLFYNQLQNSLAFDSHLIISDYPEDLRALCDTFDNIHIACQEAASHFIISGNKETLAQCCKKIKSRKIGKVKKCHFANGFHTPALKGLEQQLRVYLTKVDFKDIETPLISNVDIKPIVKGKDIEQSVMRQIGSPLYWHDVIKKFKNVDRIIIPAPSKILYKEIAAYYPDKTIVQINTPEDLKLLQ
jgi:[acyl-carrier-protein] S-malonyltransferase